MIRLIFERRDGAGAPETRVFAQTIVTIGREVKQSGASEAGWVLPYPDVSRLQCRFTRTGDVVCVEGLSERSGTFVNGTRIAGITRVSPTDRIRFGNCQLRLLEEVAAAPLADPIRAGEVRDVVPPQRADGVVPRPSSVRVPERIGGGPPAIAPDREEPSALAEQHVPEDMSPILARARRWDELGRPAGALLHDAEMVRRGREWLRAGGSMGGSAALVRVYLDASAQARRARWQRLGLVSAWLAAAVVGGSATAYALSDGLRFDGAVEAVSERKTCRQEALTVSNYWVDRAKSVDEDIEGLLLATHAVIRAEEGGCLAEAAAEQELRRRLSAHKSRLLGTHGRRVVTAAVHGMGKRAVTIDDKDEARIWDLAGGRESERLDVPAKVVAWSEEEKWLATGGPVGEVTLFDVQTWPPERKASPKGFSDRITALTIAQGSNLLAAGDERGGLRVWSLRGAATGEQRGEAVSLSGAVDTLVFDAKGAQLVTLAGGEVKVWRVVNDRLAGHTRLATADVTAMAVTPKGDRILTSNRHGQLFLWSPGKSGKGTPVREPFDTPIVSVAFVGTSAGIAATADRKLVYFHFDAPQRGKGWFKSEVFETLMEPPKHLVVAGQRALTVGEKGWPEVWDLKNRGKKPLFRLEGQKAVTAMSSTGQQPTVITGGSDGTVRVWDLYGDGGRGAFVRSEHQGEILDVALSPGGTLASSGRDGTVHIYEISAEPGSVVTHRGPLESSQPVKSLAIRDDGLWLAGVSEGEVLVWKLDGLGATALQATHHAVSHAAWSGDTGTLVTAGGGSVMEWRIDPDRLVQQSHPKQVEGEIERLAVSREFAVVSVNRGDNKHPLVALSLGEAGAAPTELRSGTSSAGALVFDPKGSRLAVGYTDNSVHVWTVDGSEFKPAQTHSNKSGVFSLSFATDGTLAIGGERGEVSVLHPDDKDVREVRTAHSRTVAGVAFGAEPSIVVSASYDMKVALQRGDGAPMELRGHTGPILRLLTDPEGRFAVSAGSDGTVRVWPLEARGLELLACETAGRGLTADERARHRGIEGGPCSHLGGG